MPKRSDSLPAAWLGLLAILLIGLTVGLGYGVEQSDFGHLLLYYLPLFVIYSYLLLIKPTDRQLTFLIGLGIALRAILLFSFPNLSDDVYRFIWDGRLILQGVSPFAELPGYYMQADNQLAGLTPELYDQLNSPDYYTIYPPLCQAIFAGANWLMPSSLYGSAVVMKLVLLCFEVGSILLITKLLSAFNFDKKNVLIYALNPLLIIEITGNLHFEGAMIFFLLLAIWLLQKGRWQLSAVAFALSVASKLLPLIFLPFLIRRLGWRRSLAYFSIVGILVVLLFLPFLSIQTLPNFGSSLDLYFQKFEFNASFYYLLRWLGQLLSGYNQIAIIGPLLGSIVLAGILWKASQEVRPHWQNLPIAMLFASSLFLFCATTIHPWYVSLPLAICVFTPYRFPVIWSGPAMLTYINYSYEPYQENLWVVAVEYLLVFGVLWQEWRRLSAT